MRSHRRWIGTLAARGTVVILAAGCGGGGHKSATTNTQAAAATAQAKPPRHTAAAAAAKAATTASALSGLATTANCRQLADLSASSSRPALSGHELEGRQEDGGDR